MAQQYPVTSITISLPQNPDANISKWSTGTSMLNISAMAKMTNGRIDPMLEGCKILVSIKKSGVNACGAYNNNTAPQANFTSVSKMWSGNAAVALLGQDCVLPPGEYELRVQFFGNGAAGATPLSVEKSKTFTIKGNEQQAYQAPQAIAPANVNPFKESEILKPISFRWTPVVPKPQEPVTYRLKVWQLMQGQNAVQAMKANQPIFEKDVVNITQTVVNNLITGPCKPPYLCDFVWNVQALNREGKAIGSNNGTSENFSFSFTNQSVKETPIKLVSPANTAVLQTDKQITFSWISPVTETPVESYKIRIVEIKGDQSPEAAFRGNKPHFEKDSIQLYKGNKPHFEKDSFPAVIFEYEKDAPKFLAGRKYAWQVTSLNKDGKPIGGNNGTSDIFAFSMAAANCVMSTTLVDAICIGTTATTKTIRVKIKIANNSAVASPATLYMNHANTFTHPLYASLSLNASNLVQGKNQSFVPSPGVNSVVAAVPLFYPTTIAQGAFVIQEVDVNINNSVTSFNLLVLSTSQGSAVGDALVPCYEDVLVANIPPCPCTYCTDNMIVLNGPSPISDANDVLTINNNISIPGVQVKQFKAELIGFSYAPSNNNAQCWVCNKDDNQWGNFIGGTFSSPFPSMVNGVFPSLPCCGGNSHHTIGWWGAATTINNKPLQLKISLPPASTLSCCPYKITFCIRYTFTDSECRSCSVVKCFSYTRQPQFGGPVPLEEIYEVSENDIKF